MKTYIFIVIALLVFSACGLRRHNLLKHKQLEEMGEQTDEAQEAMGRMISFMFGDEQILNALMAPPSQDGKPAQIPPSVMKKLIGFYINDPFFSEQILDQMESDPKSAWMNGLSSENKKKVLQITLEELMNDPGFTPTDISTSQDYEPSNETIQKITTRLINENDEIANALLSSIDQAVADKDVVAGLKLMNPDWNDWDFSNLSTDQKRQLFIWMQEHQPEQTAGEHHNRHGLRRHSKSIFGHISIAIPKVNHFAFLGAFKHN